MDVKYLFIDGGCLRATLKNLSDRYFDGRELRINYSSLKGSHLKAFYYDAIPAMKPNETDEEYVKRVQPRVALHEQIAKLPGYHIYEGDSRIRRKQVQQKEVDVMIAVDMLTHTFRGNMGRATFIASDVDFKPLLDALVREGMFVELIYPPTETSQNLVDAADERQPLSIDVIYRHLDKECRDMITLPMTGNTLKIDFDHSEASVIADDQPVGKVFYRRVGQAHSVYWDGPMSIDHFFEVRCQGYDTMRKYVQDLYRVVLPEDEPSPPLV